MITNDRQYKMTKQQINNFRMSIDSMSVITAEHVNTHPKIIEAAKSAVRSQLKELENEVQEYEALKAGKVLISHVQSLAELPLAMIKSRIANGLTQANLADKVGIKVQQIQRYEADRYESASLKTLMRIANALEIGLDGDIIIKSDVKDEFEIKNYPFKQMYERGWFGSYSGSLNDAMQQASFLIKKLFKDAGVDVPRMALTRRSVRSDGNFNEFALNAWLARVVGKAKKQEVQVTFKPETVNEEWLRGLRELSVEEDGPVKAAEYLIKSGIKFIVEPALDGTYLDGAAIITPNGTPIVAMTLRYDRLDNFWFVLLHEIAHLTLHLREPNSVIFDDLDITQEGVEKEADDYALNALVRDDVWKKALVRFNATEKGIINMAEGNGISPALIAGRLRREKSTYYKFNDLVGQGLVRKCFINSNRY